MIEILLLSLIQGITEFLPISSSSHLIILSEYLEFNNKNLEIDVSLHIGSFLAVIVFFRKDIFNFVQNKDLFLKIFIGYLIGKQSILKNAKQMDIEAKIATHHIK